MNAWKSSFVSKSYMTKRPLCSSTIPALPLPHNPYDTLSVSLTPTNIYIYLPISECLTHPLSEDDFKTCPRLPSSPKSSSAQCDDTSHHHDLKYPVLLCSGIHSSGSPTQPMSSERRHSLVDHRVTQFNTSPPISAERRHSIANTSNIPVIKPTVVRWSVRRDSEPSLIHPPKKYHEIDMTSCAKRKLRPDSFVDDTDRIAYRKDSAVDLEPTRKKLKVVATDQSLAKRRSPMPLRSPDTETANSTMMSSQNGKEQYHHPLQPSRFRWNSHHDSHHENDQQRAQTARQFSSKLSQHSASTRTSPFTITLPGITSLTEETDQSVSPLLAPINSLLQDREIGPPTPSTSGSESTSSSAATSPTMSLSRHLSQKRATRSDKGGHHQRRVGNPEYGGDFLCQEVVDRSTGRICGQTFRRSYDLSRHQTIHLKNRPFCYCTHCGKKFTRMDALRRHERVQGHRNSRNNSNSEMTKNIAAK